MHDRKYMAMMMFKKISRRAKQRMFLFLTHKCDKVENFPTQSLQIYFTGWVEKKLTNSHNRYYR